MRTRIIALCGLLCCLQATAQQNNISPLDGRQYGVVLEHPDMKKVQLKKDIVYMKDAKGSLHIDLYMPPGATSKEKRPAIIFLNAIGERPGDALVKSWGIYQTWPQLMAANGFIGISMETDANRILESIEGLFTFLSANGSTYGIDANRLGVYAASANVRLSAVYLLGNKAYAGIKAAVLYYGAVPTGPYRKDLPVLFVVSEGDVRGDGYSDLWSQVLINKAPWTITMGSNMPHAFDAFADNDDSRKLVKETISFWKNNLEPVPQPSFAHSKGRDVLGNRQLNAAKSLQQLTELAKEYPDDIQTQAVYGEFLGREQKFDEAEAVYQRIVAKHPDNIAAFLSIAALNYRQNKTEKADKYIAQVAGMKSLQSNHYIDLGFTLLVAGKDKQAAEFYEKGIAMNPAPRGVDYYNMACAYAKANSREKALLALDKAIQFGYSSKQQYANDPDLNSLRNDERFKSILARLN